MLVDSHCHLDYAELADDLAGVLDRAEAAGVGAMLTVCTELERFDEVRAIAERDCRICCSVGVHPHEAAKAGGLSVARLCALAEDPRVVGIGETGLDFYYEHSPRAAQVAAFRTHIEAARATGLPLIVHSRGADAETIEVLAKAWEEGPFPGLIHCFTAGPELAEYALGIGFMISFSGILTFKTAAPLRDIARTVPDTSLLVETDAPYLAPVPMRGRRNEPAFVTHTAGCLATVRDTSLEALAARTSANFYALFTKAKAPG